MDLHDKAWNASISRNVILRSGLVVGQLAEAVSGESLVVIVAPSKIKRVSNSQMRRFSDRKDLYDLAWAKIM